MRILVSEEMREMRGRPKENRVEMKIHVLPETDAEIREMAKGSTLGKVVDKKFGRRNRRSK